MISRLTYRALALLVATFVSYGISVAADSDSKKADEKEESGDSSSKSASWLTTKIDLQLFSHRADSISKVAARTSSDSLSKVESSIKREGLKWELYYPKIKDQISTNEELLALVSSYTEQSSAMTDSLNSRKDYFKQLETFTKNETYIISEDSLYNDLVTQAEALSLTKATAGALEKLQGAEALRFTEIDNKYSSAKDIAQSYPRDLQIRMDSLGSRYLSLQQKQGVIQGAKFTPFLQRIKDYIYGLAAVAMILTFVNMLYMKLDAAKKMAKQAKEMKKMMGGNNNDYPTI